MFDDFHRIHELYRIYQSYPTICIDSRQSVTDSLFFAVGRKDQNGHHMGNRFAAAAISSGKAAFAIINDPGLKEEFSDDPRFILVKDVEQTLQILASYHRKHIDTPILAIAVSNGKTTTKELLSACFSKSKKVFTTRGNLNNHLGVPLSLLSIQKDYDLIILEIGANHLNETRFLADLIAPDYGLVTNNGKDHIGEYGSVENIVKANKELYDHLASTNKTAFVNQSNTELVHMASTVVHQIQYGLATSCQSTILDGTPLKIELDLYGATYEISTHLFGSFWIDSVLAVICIADHFGLSIDDIREGLMNYQPEALRSQWVTWEGYQVLLDCYNANPTSMSAFLTAIYESNSSSPKHLILGEMKELGTYTESEHEMLINQIDFTYFSKVFLIGFAFESYKSNHSKIQWLPNIDNFPFGSFLNSIEKGSIYVKGSRSNQLEKIFT